MHGTESLAAVLALVDKHHVAGIVGIVIGGAVIVIVGGFRVAMRATRAVLVPIVGLAIVLLAVLVYIRTI